MKENYTKPIAEIDEFKTVDVITTSTSIDDNQKGDTDLDFGD